MSLLAGLYFHFQRLLATIAVVVVSISGAAFASNHKSEGKSISVAVSGDSLPLTADDSFRCEELLSLPDLDIYDSASVVAAPEQNHPMNSAMQFLEERLAAQELSVNDLRSLLEGKNPMAKRSDFASQQYVQVLDAMLEKFGGASSAGQLAGEGVSSAGKLADEGANAAKPSANTPLNQNWTSRLQGLLAKYEQGRVVRETKKAETKLPYREIEFIELPEGRFTKTSADGVKTTSYLQLVEYMTTPMTQAQYARLALYLNENHISTKGDPLSVLSSVFDEGPDSIKFTQSGQEYKMRPDAPVDNANYDELKGNFLVKLNQLSNISDQDIQSTLRALLPGHRFGDRYDLPTGEHHIYAKKLAVGDSGENMDVMLKTNPGIKIFSKHAVTFYTLMTSSKIGSKVAHHGPPNVYNVLPLHINGKPVYLYSGVKELVREEWRSPDPAMHGKKPVWVLGTWVDGSIPLTYGSSWQDVPAILQSSHCEPVVNHPDFPTVPGQIGFRLVRER